MWAMSVASPVPIARIGLWDGIMNGSALWNIPANIATPSALPRLSFFFLIFTEHRSYERNLLALREYSRHSRVYKRNNESTESFTPPVSSALQRGSHVDYDIRFIFLFSSYQLFRRQFNTDDPGVRSPARLVKRSPSVFPRMRFKWIFQA